MKTPLKVSENTLEKLLTPQNAFKILKILIKKWPFWGNFDYFFCAEADKLYFKRGKQTNSTMKLFFLKTTKNFWFFYGTSVFFRFFVISVGPFKVLGILGRKCPNHPKKRSNAKASFKIQWWCSEQTFHTHISAFFFCFWWLCNVFFLIYSNK